MGKILVMIVVFGKTPQAVVELGKWQKIVYLTRRLVVLTIDRVVQKYTASGNKMSHLCVVVESRTLFID